MRCHQTAIAIVIAPPPTRDMKVFAGQSAGTGCILLSYVRWFCWWSYLGGCFDLCGLLVSVVCVESCFCIVVMSYLSSCILVHYRVIGRIGSCVLSPTCCWRWISGYLTFLSIITLAADNVVLKVRIRYPIPFGEYLDWVDISFLLYERC